MNDFEDHGLLRAGCYSLQVGAPNPTYLKRVAGHLEVSVMTFLTSLLFIDLAYLQIK